MADSEIQILIKAVDQVTATMKGIESSLKTSNSNVQKSNQSLSDSFSKVQGAMLNLGQIAQGIHSIFETQERVTRNLENSQDRLQNAELRLSQATETLALAQQKLSDIEENHAKDSITLERAQFKLTDAQKELKVYTDRLAEGVTFGEKKQREYEEAILNVKEAQIDLTDAQNLGTKKAQELVEAAKSLKANQDAVTIANNQVERAERALAKTTEDAKWAYLDMGVQALSAAGNVGVFINTLSKTSAITTMTTEAGLLTSAIGIGGLAATAGVAGAMLGLYLVLNGLDKPAREANKVIEDQIAMYEALKLSVNYATGQILELMIMEERQKQYKAGKWSPKLTMQNVGVPTLPAELQAQMKTILTPGITVSDGLIRPGQKPVSFSPQDTLIATKNPNQMGGGITIYITGNNYGVNPNDIATILEEKIRNKIIS